METVICLSVNLYKTSVETVICLSVNPYKTSVEAVICLSVNLYKTSVETVICLSVNPYRLRHNIFLNIFQLYHGEKKLHFDEDDDDDVCFDLDQYTELDFYSASSLKQTVCR